MRPLETLEDLLLIPPFHAYLGVKLLAAETGRAVLRVPYKEELIGNPLVPAIHGGILAAMIDLAGGVVLFHDLGIPTPTVDMRVDYLRPALAGLDLVAEARAKRVGATIAFVDVEVWQVAPGGAVADEPRRLVATGRCVYSTKDRERPPPAGAVPIG